MYRFTHTRVSGHLIWRCPGTCQFPPVRPPNNTNMRPTCLNFMQHYIYLSPNCPCRRVFRAQFLLHCQQQPQNNVANMIIFDANMLPDGSPPRYIWSKPVCFSLASLLTQYMTRLVPGALPVSRWTPWTLSLPGRPCFCAFAGIGTGPTSESCESLHTKTVCRILAQLHSVAMRTARCLRT